MLKLDRLTHTPSSRFRPNRRRPSGQKARACRFEALEPRTVLSAVTILADDGITPQTFENTTPLAIRDADTVESTITIPASDDFPIADLDVQLDISHKYDADLDAYLIYDDGNGTTREIMLFTDVGGKDDNFTGTILDDEAETPITSGSAPFTGRYRPEGALSAVDGLRASGTWTLRITDDLKGAAGTLNFWSLTFVGAPIVPPGISIDNVQFAEGDSGTAAFIFTVTRTGDASGTTSVDYQTADGTATASSGDYVAAFGQVEFLAGETEKKITVQVNGDTSVEPTETFTVNLSNNPSIADGEGAGTILDDDATPTISYPNFSDTSGLNLVGAAAAPVTTNDGSVLRLTPALDVQAGGAWYSNEKQYVSAAFETTFSFRLHAGSDGGDGSDGFAFVIQNVSPTELRGAGGHLGYHDLPNSLAVEFDTWLDAGSWGDPSKSHISVQTRGVDPNSTYGAYSLGSYDTLGDGILLDDAQVHTARISYVPGTLTVSLDNLGPVLTVDVDLAKTLDLDFGRAWVGFTGATGIGWQNQDILNWDYRVQGDTTTIIGIDDVSRVEGDEGTTDLLFAVTRLGDISGTSTVDWAAVDGTATAGIDYTAAPSQVIFGPNDTTKYITVSAVGDTLEEGHETFFVNLSNVAGASIGDGRAKGTILNDDTSLSIDDATVMAGDQRIGFLGDFIAPGNGGLDTPGDVVLGPDGLIYVSSQESDSVLRYNAATGAFDEAFVPSGAGGLDAPHGMVFDSNGNLYVASRLANKVLRYDTNGAVDEFVAYVNHPVGLAFGPDGHLYVAAAHGDEVLRFNAATGDIIDTVISGADGLTRPHGLVFDAYGLLYVTSQNTDEVFRVNPATGQIDVFVGTQSGGLDAPVGLLFGPDGNGDGVDDLYVSSGATDSVLRYDGTTGEFMDEFVTSGSGGLDRPRGMLFDSADNLYVSSALTDQVLRYGSASQAVFTVSLSSPSALPVTAAFSTANGTAVAGDDYTPTSDTLVFDPGVTSRRIIVPIDDTIAGSEKTFFVNLSDPVNATTTDGTGTGTILGTATTTYVSTDVPKSFPRRSWQTTESTIVVPDSYEILLLEVHVTQTEEPRALNLFAPDGVTHVSVQAPYTRTEIFNGMNVQGTWTLQIWNWDQGVNGKVTDWSIEVTHALATGSTGVITANTSTDATLSALRAADLFFLDLGRKSEKDNDKADSLAIKTADEWTPMMIE